MTTSTIEQDRKDLAEVIRALTAAPNNGYIFIPGGIDRLGDAFMIESFQQFKASGMIGKWTWVEEELYWDIECGDFESFDLFVTIDEKRIERLTVRAFGDVDAMAQVREVINDHMDSIDIGGKRMITWSLTDIHQHELIDNGSFIYQY